VTAGPQLRKHRARAIAVTGGMVLALAAFLLAMPMPYHTHAEGVLWLPEEALVRAGANGFVGTFLVQPGTRVAEGDALIQCYDPAVKAQVRRGEAKVAELEAAYTAEFASDQVKAQIVRDKLAGERASLALARERASDLVVRASTGGVFIAPDMVDMPERYYRKGELMGYVLGKARPLARVVVPQEAVDKVRLATEHVRVRLSEGSLPVLEGRVVREVPAGDEMLPSPALASQGGGEIATDPREAKGSRALRRVFQFDVELDAPDRLDHFGQRVYVRFEHEMEPLSVQWYRSIRLLFLTSFYV
jgi:putative peptide zinc metalloprotease protein